MTVQVLHLQCSIRLTHRFAWREPIWFFNFPYVDEIFQWPRFAATVVQFLIHPFVLCMKYDMPGLAPTDVSWRTHSTSKQFPAMHVKFSHIICINWAVPSCKTTTGSTTTLKICGRDAIKTILSQGKYVWTWNASAAFCNPWSISSFCLTALSVDNIPSQLLDFILHMSHASLDAKPAGHIRMFTDFLVWSEYTNYNNQISKKKRHPM